MLTIATTSRKLQFQGEKSPSIAPKAAITTWYLICVVGAAWLTFSETSTRGALRSPGRQAVLFACALLYIVRAAATLFVFVKRKIPWWEAMWGGSLIGLVLFLFLRRGLLAPQPLCLADVGGILFYLIGSYVGTASEYSRHLWKARPENQGHLYTQGYFRYSRHINYFGDLLLFSGFAFLTQQLWTAFVPLAMGLNFAFVIIPAHDAYLAIRYGSEFEDYARRTRKLLPFLY